MYDYDLLMGVYIVLGDILIIIKWWLYILLIGILFLPFTQKYFRSFYDKGYGFSKVLGILALSYCSWLLSSLGIISSNRMFAVIIPLAFIPLAAYICRGSNILGELKENGLIILLEEVLFIGILFVWCYIRGLQPDIFGLEKYMDFGFVNAILRANSMPPVDIWFAGKGINYYYFGHYICAYLTRLTGTEPAIAYNLMMATLASLAFLLTFSISSNLLYLMKRFDVKRLVIAGLIAASLLTFGGNLHSFLYGYGVTGDVTKYYYPDSTRYIGYNPPTDDKTIHEFPSYSFIVSDIHGHVSDIPAVLTFMAVLLGCFAAGEGIGRLGLSKVLLLGFLLSTIYMTNTWDYPIYITVMAITLLYRHTCIYFNASAHEGDINGLKPANPVIKTLAVMLAAIALSQVFAIPYTLNFESISAGVGLVRYRTPLYQLAVLWGYQLFYVLCFAVFLTAITSGRMKAWRRSRPATGISESWFGRLLRNIAVPDMLCLILCCCGLGLLLIPEIVYVSDIYSGGYHRANTMFKLTYQAFIMFCIAAGYITVRLPSSLRLRSVKALTAALLLLVYFLPMTYFPLALKGYYKDWRPVSYKGINGLQFLESKYPEDYGVIKWLNANVKRQPTILEAHGDSYTYYGRISMATGLPTVQGWFVHEWLWRNDRNEPESRGKEVAMVYESDDISATRDIIKKYGIQYVIIGDMEREKFADLKEDKLLTLGEVVFEEGNTKVIMVR